MADIELLPLNSKSLGRYEFYQISVTKYWVHFVSIIFIFTLFMWKKIYTISKRIISIFLSVANYDKSIEIILFTQILVLFIHPVKPSVSVI